MSFVNNVFPVNIHFKIQCFAWVNVQITKLITPCLAHNRNNKYMKLKLHYIPDNLVLHYDDGLTVQTRQVFDVVLSYNKIMLPTFLGLCPD